MGLYSVYRNSDIAICFPSHSSSLSCWKCILPLPPNMQEHELFRSVTHRHTQVGPTVWGRIFIDATLLFHIGPKT